MTTGSALQAATAPCWRRNRAPGLRNTTGLSGELSAGDLVAVGSTLLAVGRPAGWEPATSPLTEVRTREHGTVPLPLPGPAPCSEPAPGAGKENHGE